MTIRLALLATPLLTAAILPGCKQPPQVERPTTAFVDDNHDGTCKGSQRGNICPPWNKANRGGDDRLDIHCLRRRDIEVPAAPAIEARSTAVAALFFAKDLGDPKQGTYALGDPTEIPPLGEISGLLGLCKDETFADQPRGARCSSVLVDHHTLLTASHCWRTDEKMAFVFDFFMPPTGKPTRIEVSEGSVCRPAKDPRPVPDGPGLTLIDIVCPDGFNREPVDIAPSMPSSGNVYAIGFPYHLPGKFSGWGPFKRKKDPISFHAELDIFPGNSGSPVFDEDHRLVGIVESDSSDDTCPSHDPSESCYRWASIPPNSGIELTINSTHIIPGVLKP